MLSICIPTYNHNITSLVTEVIAQCNALNILYEIQVLNDGSSIAESTILEKSLIDSSKVNYNFSENNMGRTATRNFLARHSTFNWLLFLDADVRIDNKSFISSYVESISEKNNIIFGGVAYEERPPKNEFMLRWKYGSSREVKTAKERLISPHFIISQNLLILKNTFLTLNDLDENRYGLDNYFSSRIKKLKIPILHIDNPVIHLGLENNSKFLSKGIKAVQTLVYLENENKISSDLTPLQRAYSSLKKYHTISIFKAFVDRNMKRIEKNLTGSNPSLKLYDIYRLYHYILAKNKNA